MVDSVSGGRPQTPIESFQEQQKADQAEKADKIGLSYASGNSMSHHTADKGDVSFAVVNPHAPSISEPDTTTATGEELSAVKSQSHASQLRAGVYSSFDLLQKNHPELVTPELEVKAEELKFKADKMGFASSIPDGLAKDIQQSVTKLQSIAESPNLDADKLEQVMSEIQTKMDDNSAKLTEFSIKSRSADAQVKYDQNIEKIEEHIKEVEEAKAKQASSSGGWFAGLIMAIFPPLALYEAGVQIAEEINGSDSDVSLLSRNNAFGKALSDAEKGIEEAFTDAGNEANQAFTKAGKEISDTFEPMGKKEAWENLGDELKQDAKAMGKDIEQAFTKAGEDLKQDAKAMGKDIDQAFSKAGDDIAATVKPIGDKKTWDDSGDKILAGLGIEPTSGNKVPDESSFAVEQEKMKMEKELAVAMQGLDVGESAMTSQEMMKLLQQMKAAEESKEKLEEAIAALESGDLDSLKEIAAGLSGGDAIIDMIDNPETATAGLTQSLLDVPAETAKMQDDQKLHSTMAKRFS
ncbi:hypothetical protein [Endozoicomonas lisbonensis]|uniref:Exonuclease VII small subunit n=1 Tax=Endozoicomonas lisbonensis TaxID=3120522 RepID=A0ABV2SIZ7_9GAMM